MPLPTPDDVRTAARRLDGVVRRTPLRLTSRLDPPTYLKLENEQVTGSFKLRGAYNAIATLSEEVRARGVVASSAGNHGLGVAFAARAFGISARIFVPETAPRVKKEGIASHGAVVDDSTPDYDAAMTAAKAWGKERGATYINPCLGDSLLAGQGTLGLEILDGLPELATLVVPVGGAGLLGGIAGYVRRVAPRVRIVGAQSVHTAAMSRSLAAGRLVEIPSVATLADGLAGQIDDEALAIGRAGLDAIVTLEEEEIAAAIAWLAREEGIVAEGAGAVAVGALLHRKLHSIATPVVAIVSGGNIDRERHERLLVAHGATNA